MQLSNKMRPMRFKDVKGQTNVVQALKRQSQMDQWFNCYIFSGQFGGGKTTMARLVALAANCTNKGADGEPCLSCAACRAVTMGCEDVAEIDGASNTGVDNIRRLQETVACLPMRLKKRVIIIDEVHMLSQGAFNSALKMLEEPPEHCIFILCTTEVSAIPQTIFSRSAHYSFSSLSIAELVEGIAAAVQKLGVKASQEAMELIATHSSGSMRNAMVLVDQIAVGAKEIDETLCKQMLGITDERLIIDLVSAIMQRDMEQAVKVAVQISSQGVSLSLVSKEVISRCSDILTTKHLSGERVQFYCTSTVRERIIEIAQSCTYEYLAIAVDVLSDFAKMIKTEQSRECMLVGCAKAVSRLAASDVGLSERILAIEMRLKEAAPAGRERTWLPAEKIQQFSEAESSREDMKQVERRETPEESAPEGFESGAEGSPFEEKEILEEETGEMAAGVMCEEERAPFSDQPEKEEDIDILGLSGYNFAVSGNGMLPTETEDSSRGEESGGQEINLTEDSGAEDESETGSEARGENLEENPFRPEPSENSVPCEDAKEECPEISEDDPQQDTGEQEDDMFSDELSAGTSFEDSGEVDGEDEAENFGFHLPKPKVPGRSDECVQEEPDGGKPGTEPDGAHEEDGLVEDTAEDSENHQAVEQALQELIEKNYALQSVFYFGDAVKCWEGNVLVLLVESDADLYLIRSYLAYAELENVEVRLTNNR